MCIEEKSTKFENIKKYLKPEKKMKEINKEEEENEESMIKLTN